MSRIHALLVGINEYVAVTPLHGCVADIVAVETLLRSRVPPETLNVFALHDAAATRAAIIDGFRTHLKQAAAGDIALFYYCGHGSQEHCPPEWLALEPSGKNQTIVSVDARANDVFDIADKELSALIHDVASSGAQVVTMFDSCHSGGVTRDVNDDADPHAGMSRMTDASTARARTLDDYLDIARVLYDPARIATEGPPAPSHLAIAACQADQLAKEFPKQPPRRGAFTQAFEEAVLSLGPSATYIDLVTTIRTKVRGRATEQLPNLSVSGAANAATVFMAGHVGRRDLTVDADDTGAWWLSSGTITGIPAIEGGNVTTIAVFPRDAFDDASATPVPLATATLDIVLGDRSRLRFTTGAAALDVAKPYIGTVTGMGTAPLNVMVTGAPADSVAAVTRALSVRSGVYALVKSKQAAVPTITVSVDSTAAQVIGTDDAPMLNQRFSLEPASLQSLANACVHLARWHGTRDRRPIASTFNDKVFVDLIPVAAGESGVPSDRAPLPTANGSVVATYTGDQPPLVQFRLRNTSTARLFVALIDLSDSYGCSVMFADWIPAGGVALVDGGKIKKLTIASWRDPSYRVGTDLFKIFAATEQFDTDALTLPSLLKPRLDGATRDAEDVDEPDASFWGTTLLRVETRR